MTISLSRKFFLAMLAVCAFAVLGMVFAAYLSLKYGFLGYLNQQAEERMDALVPRVERPTPGTVAGTSSAATRTNGSNCCARWKPNRRGFSTRPASASPT